MSQYPDQPPADQPPAAQPPADQPPAAQPYPGGAGYAEDPGRTLGIVGLVLAIVASFIGLIISIVAFRKSKRAGFNNGLAKAGIIVGIITTIASLIVATFLIVGVVALTNKCKELGPGVQTQNGVTYNCPG
ncbi:MAG: hypothetical protein ABWY56_01120 [Propionibacteriaceae bacterium]